MSDGVTKTGSKPRGFGALKAKYETRIEELERELAESKARRQTSEVLTFTHRNDDYDPTIDPLSCFIGADRVHLIGKLVQLEGHIFRTPSQVQAGEKVEPVWRRGTGVWACNPFKYAGKTHQETEDLKFQNREHHFFTIERHWAERVAESRYGKMQDKAIIRPEDFELDRYEGRPIGTKRPASGDPLVEILRYHLQSKAGSLWVDFAYHNDVMTKPGVFCREIPNPYGVKYERHRVDSPVVMANAEGDFQREGR